MADEQMNSGKVLSSGTNMNWRVHNELTLEILNDQLGEVDGTTMYDDLIFSHHPTQNQDWLIGRGGQEGCLDE